MIHLVLPGLPPSSNHAYFNAPGRGRVLTDAGRKYKTGVAVLLQQKYRKELMFLRPNVPYAVVTKFHVEQVETLGYPKKAKNRYKTLDGSNRLKLLEDVLATASGIDDSQFMQGLWVKVRGMPEQTEVWFWNLEEEESPFDGTIRAL